MYLSSLALTNFRNYSRLNINLQKRNIFLGENATGKTNLLEAVYFLSVGSGFKSKSLKTLINQRASWATITGDLLIKDQKLNLKGTLQYQPGTDIVEKRLVVNKKPQKTYQFLGRLKTVCFLPQHLFLIEASPGQRRKYFNLLIAQLSSEYYKSITDYKKIVLARNKILNALQKGRSSRLELVFWNRQLIRTGALIFLIRKRVVDFLNQIWEKIFPLFSSHNPSSRFTLHYHSFLPSSQNHSFKKITQWYQRKLQEIEMAEIKAGYSLLGPHRDDFVFYYGDDKLCDMGSQGEFRQAILALKFAEVELIERFTKEKPVLLLDDITSELDSIHRNQAFKLIENYQNRGGQIFITAIEKREFPSTFLNKACVFEIKNHHVCLSS